MEQCQKDYMLNRFHFCNLDVNSRLRESDNIAQLSTSVSIIAYKKI